MATFLDSMSQLSIGDTEALPRILKAADITTTDMATSSRDLILSASGWRKVFAHDGDEENGSEDVLARDLVLMSLMARQYGLFLLDQKGGDPSKLRILVGQDARPTGTLLADAMIRTFISMGFSIDYAFIASAPEIFCHAKLNPTIDGFAYISASHNPVGHNGVKFGLDNGGVLNGQEVGPMISSLQASFQDQKAIDRALSDLLSLEERTLSEIFEKREEVKKASLASYHSFSTEILANSAEKAEQDRVLSQLKEDLTQFPQGIVAELNGSARGVTIDKDFFESLGVKVKVVNGTPRNIVHRIVPEGRSLNLCMEELVSARTQDPSFTLGYVPDNDGDRGNLVFFDTEQGKARQIEAQEIFALSVMAELSSMVYDGKLSYDDHGKAQQKVAVAVNGPTSMRIEELCRAFDVEVFRAEVGEANVVNLAGNLRDQGYAVRILGEGSNGGNITHPAAVRDPLNTIGAILKLLSQRDRNGRPGLFHIWCDRSGQEYKADFGLSEALASLPHWTTTSAYEDKAILKINSTSHGPLKAKYEQLFPAQWEEKKAWLEKTLGAVSWEEINYEGTEAKIGVGPQFRSGAEKGGFKILLKNKNDQPVAYLWMRGSGTEPVFRVLVDVVGNDASLEEQLLAWHVSIISQADKD